MSTKAGTASDEGYAPPGPGGIAGGVDLGDPAVVVLTTPGGRVLRIPRERPADEHAVAGPALPAALFDALTPAARGVLEIAEDLRAEHGRPAVYTEHLLVGLLLEAGSPGPTLLDRARLTLADVRARLEAVGLDSLRTVVEPDGRVAAVLPMRGDRPLLRAFPPLSTHAALAFEHAARLAGWRPALPVDAKSAVGARDLLRALAGQDAALAVQLFPDLWEWVGSVLDDLGRDAGHAEERSSERGAPAEGAEPVAVRELNADQLAELVPSLSESVRRALGVADAFRRARGGDAVHVEHLVVGTHAEPGGHQWYAFDDAGISPERLAERLARFELRVRAAASDRDNSGTRLVLPRGGPIDAMPPLSAHARLALAAAAFAAGWTPGQPPHPGTVQARHLLTGIFSVRDCSVVQALADARPAVHAALARRVDQDVAAGDFSAELGADQHRRLDLLLTDPPGFVFAPLPDTPAPAPRPLVGAGRGGTNDRAEGEDRLGFDLYVRAFAELVDSPDTSPPLTIGIFGSWGAGKSFLLTKLKERVQQRSATLRPSEFRVLGRRLSRMLRRQEAPQRERHHVYCVDFNAWEYDAAPQIWPRLVRRVLDCVESSVRFRHRPWRWLATRGARTWRNLWRLVRDGWKDVVAWAVLGVALAALVTWDVPGDRTSIFEFVVGQPIDDKLNLSLLLGALGAVAKLLKDALLAPVGRWVTAMLADGRGYGLESDAMAAVRRDLELLDRRLSAERSRVLIVIDDLDRCEPEKAVEMLQAINLLLDRKSFIICLGIDARVVTAAVERHYREILGPAGITGYEYLDKIIQIPFSIPEPSADDLAGFVARQMNRSAPPPRKTPAPVTGPAPAGRTGEVAFGAHDGADGARAATAPDDAATPSSSTAGGPTPEQAAQRARAVLDATSAVLGVVAPLQGALVDGPARDLFDGLVDPQESAPETLSFTEAEELAFRDVTPYLRRNPRHVKRLVNVYALVRSLATLRGERRILDDPGATVRWLTLCGQWPYATRELLRAASEMERAGAAPTAAGSPPLAQLLALVAPGLDPARRHRFDHTPELLADLVRTSGDLSWDELLVLRRYTLNFNPALESELRGTEARRASAEG